MEFDVLKVANIEICESIYALSMNYLKTHNNDEISFLLISLNKIESNIRKCKDINALKKYIVELNSIINRIEGIINE